MRVIFSDLDGTLLHPRTYSFDAARPALEALRRQKIPLVLATSKTRAEVEDWRLRMDNGEPFIVENGGAIYIPRGYFKFTPEWAKRRGDYEVIEFGTPYQEAVNVLRSASTESGCPVLGFDDMTVAEVCTRTFLTVRQAEMAKRREYDEPFLILGGSAHALLEAIERRGKRYTRGDRFYHINGGCDKALAVAYLTRLYRQVFGEVATVGVGDSENDAKFLATVDEPVVIRSQFSDSLKQALPASIVTNAPGPYGWTEGLMRAAALAPMAQAAG